jgi:signal transduction histidine kinase
MHSQGQKADYITSMLERERVHIGQELHDNISQRLAVITLYVKMLNPHTKSEMEIRDKVVEQLNSVMVEIGALSKGLVAPKLKTNGLVESIKELIENIHDSKALQISFNYDRSEFPISSDKSVALFRIIQEQLRNILQHSQAGSASISLHIADDQVILSIADNGLGFNPQQHTAGIGLSNMRERAALYEGMIDIQTEMGKGCKVIVRIPVNR